MADQRKDIIIVGAGAVGLSVALALSQKGFQIALLEKGNPSDKAIKTIADGHTTALMSNSINVIKSLGVWNEVKPFCEPMRVLRILDPEQDEHVDFSSAELGKRGFGYNVPQSVLRTALLRKVKKAKSISYLPETNIQNIETAETHVVVETDKEKLSSSLLIASDGRRSICRKLLGINIKEKLSNQSALTFLVSHEQDHKQVSTEIYKKGGPLTFVPMIGGKQSSVVWVNEREVAEKILHLSQNEQREKLQAQSHNILGALEIKSDLKAWPLSHFIATDFSAQRAVFVGETAHGFSPVGAQGLNLSYRDIETLVGLLNGAARLGQDVGSELILQRYASLRKKDTIFRYHGVGLLNYLIKTDGSFVKAIRTIGLKMAGNILPLKHYLVKEGMSPKVKKTGQSNFSVSLGQL